MDVSLSLWGPTNIQYQPVFCVKNHLSVCVHVHHQTQSFHHTQFLYLMACPVGGTSLEPFDLDRGHSRGWESRHKASQDIGEQCGAWCECQYTQLSIVTVSQPIAAGQEGQESLMK